MHFKKQYLSKIYYEIKTKEFYELQLGQMFMDDLIKEFYELRLGKMFMDDLINEFLDLLRFVSYRKEDKVKIQRFFSCLPQYYKDIIEFHNPKSLNEVFRQAIMCYEQYKHIYEIPKAFNDKKQDKLNQRKKGLQRTPFHNMTKGFKRKEYPSNTQHTQGGNKLVNFGFKKVGDNSREPLKCWECEGPHLWRNCPHLNLSIRSSIHNLQYASMLN
jgi:hypothetical protein